MDLFGQQQKIIMQGIQFLLDQNKRNEVIQARSAANYLKQLAKNQKEIDELNTLAEKGNTIDLKRLDYLENQQVF